MIHSVHIVPKSTAKQCYLLIIVHTLITVIVWKACRRKNATLWDSLKAKEGPNVIKSSQRTSPFEPLHDTLYLMLLLPCKNKHSSLWLLLIFFFYFIQTAWSFELDWAQNLLSTSNSEIWSLSLSEPYYTYKVCISYQTQYGAIPLSSYLRETLLNGNKCFI